eukprot:1159480-Pelagomonas_calceolata.AAC.3
MRVRTCHCYTLFLAGLSTSNTRLSSGAIGAPESRLEVRSGFACVAVVMIYCTLASARCHTPVDPEHLNSDNWGILTINTHTLALTLPFNAAGGHFSQVGDACRSSISIT